MRFLLHSAVCAVASEGDSGGCLCPISRHLFLPVLPIVLLRCRLQKFAARNRVFALPVFVGRLCRCPVHKAPILASQTCEAALDDNVSALRLCFGCQQTSSGLLLQPCRARFEPLLERGRFFIFAQGFALIDFNVSLISSMRRTVFNANDLPVEFGQCQWVSVPRVCAAESC